MKKLVIFDLDGTLFDSEKVEHQFALQISKENNLGITNQFLNDRIGTDSNSVHNAFVSLLGSEDKYRAFSKRLHATKEQYFEVNGLPWKKGAISIISQLRSENFIVALATSTTRPVLDKYETYDKFYEYFDFTICGDEVEFPKPNPECYLEVMKHFLINSNETIIVEDSPSGTQSAVSSGARTIWIKDLVEIPVSLKEEVIICSDLYHALDKIKTS